MKVIVSDIDGSLMPIGDGNKLDQKVIDAMIQLQEMGYTILLNSARVYEGVIDIARMIHLDQFGGYIISSNGCHAVNAKTNEVIFQYEIPKEDVMNFWHYCQSLNLEPAFYQPGYMVVADYTEGFALDHFNCNLDYLITEHPENHLIKPVIKCAIAQDPDTLKKTKEQVNQWLIDHTQMFISGGIPTLYDVIDRRSSKDKAVERILEHIGCTWKDTTVIGDGLSDVDSIRKAHFGVTLQDSNPACQAVCDLLLPPIKEEGYMVWLNKLLNKEI